MNRKAKGSRNERKSKALLELWGYTVSKSGGSLGTFDLIGINSVNIILVQCKTNGRPDDDELYRILDFDAPPDAIKEVHIWIDRKSEPLILQKEQIRRILDGEPFKINAVPSINNNRRRSNNARKTKNSTKRVGKTNNRTTRSVSDKPAGGRKRPKPVGRKRKTARVA